MGNGDDSSISLLALMNTAIIESFGHFCKSLKDGTLKQKRGASRIVFGNFDKWTLLTIYEFGKEWILLNCVVTCVKVNTLIFIKCLLTRSFDQNRQIQKSSRVHFKEIPHFNSHPFGFLMIYHIYEGTMRHLLALFGNEQGQKYIAGSRQIEVDFLPFGWLAVILSHLTVRRGI